MFYNFISKYTDVFVGKMREAFHIFFNRNIGVFVINNICNFNETLINNVVSFEQPGLSASADMSKVFKFILLIVKVNCAGPHYINFAYV